MKGILDHEYVVVNRFYSGYLKEFIDEYSERMELGQESYFTIFLDMIDELKEEYPSQKDALMELREEMSSFGATKCVVLVWW